jgi:hypothetical protein
MKIGNTLKSLVLGLMLATTGCGMFADPYVADGTIGGLSGAGLGAGAGALVAMGMENGDIANSSLVGAAVGLPVGILLGVAYRSHIEQKILDENNEKIRQNYQYIMARQQEIEQVREDIREESFAIEPDRSLKSHIYTGATIGMYNRP